MTGPDVVTALSLASRFVGIHEAPGAVHNPAIVAMLDLIDPGIHDDETPWCSAFVNYVTWLLSLPRSKSLSARSWLVVGQRVTLDEARPGYDVVVLARGIDPPSANVLHAPGHVGFFVDWDKATRTVRLLGGNQGDRVCMEDFPASRVLGVRRLL